MEQVGIVMEVRGKHAIILTKDGRFVKIQPKASVHVGQQMLIHPSLGLNEKSRFGRFQARQMRRSVLAGTTAAAVALAAGLYISLRHPAEASPYAYVSVDANPSVSFQLDKNEHVIRVSGINQNGEQLLSTLREKNVSLKGKTLQDALSVLMRFIVTGNFVSPGDSVLVAAAPAGNSKLNSAALGKIENDAEADVKEALKQDISVPSPDSIPHVYSMSLSQTLWNAAANANVSPARLAAYLVAKDEGMNVTMGELNSQSIQQAFTQVKHVRSVLNQLSDNSAETLIQKLIMSGALAGDTPSTQPISSPGGNAIPKQPESNSNSITVPSSVPSLGSSANSSDNTVNNTANNTAGTPRGAAHDGKVSTNRTSGATSGVPSNSTSPQQVTITVGNTSFYINMGSSTGITRDEQTGTGKPDKENRTDDTESEQGDQNSTSWSDSNQTESNTSEQETNDSGYSAASQQTGPEKHKQDGPVNSTTGSLPQQMWGKSEKQDKQNKQDLHHGDKNRYQDGNDTGNHP